MSDAVNGDLIRGNIDTIILSVLLTNDNYGYEIIKAIRRKSGGKYELKEPTLYSSLRRMEAQKAIESYWGNESQGARRKYYRITPLGVALYKKNLEAWQSARDLIDRLIVVEEASK
ncbi:PadR family transcriptional regulator [Alicyclobacillus contaminans]|uniref:PadR family transcriptional regulator n=1 Tax=Alicyclobacillus contaminans TaxID=392016 RepID=UPI0004198594|nr:PadR family transcriptional regulator [Alicyclobacillus contaminans]GMA51512.1 PadR family transcriptional regulator [Alicyclobacillus contaminans]